MLSKPSRKVNRSSRKTLDQVPFQGHTARARYLRGDNSMPIFSSEATPCPFLPQRQLHAHFYLRGKSTPIFSSERSSEEFLKESCE